MTVSIFGHSISPSFGFCPCFRSKSNVSKFSIRRFLVDGSVGAETVFIILPPVHKLQASFPIMWINIEMIANNWLIDSIQSIHEQDFCFVH